MAKQTINVGTVANDGTGDTLRSAGQKVNANFTEVYDTSQAAFNKANTTSNTLSIAYNTANAAFQAANSKYRTILTIATGGISQLTLENDVVFCDPNAAGEDIEIRLPLTPVSGKTITIKNINTGANIVKISANSSHYIELTDHSIGINVQSQLTATGHLVTWIWDNGTWRVLTSFIGEVY